MDSLIVDFYASLYFYHCIRTECLVLILEYIAELVADALSLTDGLVDVPVGMTVDPVGNRTSGNVIT